MSYFTTPALSSGQDWDAHLDAVWTDTTVSFTFSSTVDLSYVIEVYGSADEGQTWFYLASISASTNPCFITDKPINAIKIGVLTLNDGYSFTASVTGA